MNLHRKANIIAWSVAAGCVAVSLLLYFVFHIVFIFLIFIPPVIYYLLSKRDTHGDSSA